MEIYAIVDEDLQVAKHRSKGTLAVFKDLEMLKKHAWRYKESGKSYKIAELEPINFFSFEETEGEA
ncbi:TPA: hypothetical protein H1100_002776 [Listeria monocytogenes]|uniref:hypothetical protein n=1 Tax=Listeria monocytogenes TaxID=1639 RepID=UPI0009315313|nr:hypothetical protein [Listeria monocytogenes]EAF0199546.1 hypothetical protein [Listeria monocytogenes]EAF3004385.1 hypothetical protein [Listeria monocytogenes]EAG1169694.1 hypothetical protein [Listeria monocytogenes]EDH0798978.1 hypothetical protein [Listeria monocytogenes]EEO9407573.1 hypothetical protein [Listeria monocytogenes]